MAESTSHENAIPITPDDSNNSNKRERRLCCHRCGNIRKKSIQCRNCPNVYCVKCAEKMLTEHGLHAFTEGCPNCKGLCCCRDKLINCPRMFHCMKKCPCTRSLSPPQFLKTHQPVEIWDSDSEVDQDIFVQKDPEANVTIPEITSEIIPSDEKPGNDQCVTCSQPQNEIQSTPVKKRKYNKIKQHNDRFGKLPKTIIDLEEPEVKQPFPAFFSNIGNNFTSQLAEKSMQSLSRGFSYNPYYSPSPAPRFKPVLQPISTIIAATEARTKLPICGVPALSNKPLLPTLIGQLLPAKPVEQILPLPPLNLEMESQKYTSGDKLPPLNFSRTAIFSPTHPRALAPFSRPINPEEKGGSFNPHQTFSYPSLPSLRNWPGNLQTSCSMSGFGNTQSSSPLIIETNFPVIDSCGASTSSTECDRSPYFQDAATSPIRNSNLNRDFDALAAQIQIPQMVDTIHDPFLEEPFTLNGLLAYENTQLHSTQTLLQSTSADIARVNNGRMSSSDPCPALTTKQVQPF